MRAVQIAAVNTKVGSVERSTLVVLTDDGQILEYAPKDEKKWKLFPPIPDSIFELEKLKPVDEA